MKEILLKKMVNGSFYPINEEEEEKLESFKMGAVVKCKISVMRNYKFFAKWWALAKLAFEFWEEGFDPPKYKGIEILPDFDRFRKDLIILSGKRHMVVDVNGNVHAEADSLAWGKMSEEDFEKLYSNTINVVLKKVYASSISEEELRNRVEEIMNFS